MNVLIIEDEYNAAYDLQQMITILRPGYTITGLLDSVESALKWLDENEQPDLILSDVQLGDGLCFEIFETVELTCPIIFITAYNEFMLQAFETNGISYLLKPLEQDKLEAGLFKVETLTTKTTKSETTIQDITRLLSQTHLQYRSSFLIAYKEKRFPVSVQDIAYFSLKNTFTYVHTFQGKSYMLAYRLEELESLLDPKLFFRANRQYLISFQAITEVEEYFARKTLVQLKVATEEKVIVSKPKSALFLHWLENR